MLSISKEKERKKLVDDIRKEEQRIELQSRNVVCWPFCYSIPDIKNEHTVQIPKKTNKIRSDSIMREAVVNLTNEIQWLHKDNETLKTVSKAGVFPSHSTVIHSPSVKSHIDIETGTETEN